MIEWSGASRHTNKCHHLSNYTCIYKYNLYLCINYTAIKTPNFDIITPQDCINGKVRRLHRMLDSVYQSKLKSFKVKGSTLSILFIIGNRKSINQKSLAETLALDQSTISRDVKRLAQRSLIRMQSGNDPRTCEWQLTVQGKSFLEKLIPVWQEIHSEIERLLGEFSIQNIDFMISALRHNLPILK